MIHLHGNFSRPPLLKLVRLIMRLPHEGAHNVGAPLKSCLRCSLDAELVRLQELLEKGKGDSK